jgi:glutamyl-tRNA synthetase
MPDALRNYLLRLGWSFEDKEIFTLDESIEHFNLDGIGKSPSKLDMSRILSMNEYYIKNIDESELYKNFVEYCEIYKEKINPEKEVKIKLSLPFLKNKAKTLEDIYNNAKYIISDEIIYKDDDLKLIDEKAKKIIKHFKDNLSKIDELSRENLEPVVNILIKNYETNFKGVGQPLRVALTGSKFGPGLYDIVISLGKEEVKKRLESKIFI